jgi:FixJ family two-component response regulator
MKLQSMISQFASLAPACQLSGVEPLVCVIDDEESVRQSLWRLFHSVRLPVRSFSSATEYLNHGSHDGPCCLVLDVNLPGMNGFELQQALAEASEQMVFVTDHGDVPMCARAMKNGAVDFLIKPLDDKAMLDAVFRALARSRNILVSMAAKAAARTKIARLTPREFAVMQRVVEGMLNKQIAADLGIAEKTIKVHRGRMMHKMGIVSVPDLVRLVLAAGLPEPVRIWSAS